MRIPHDTSDLEVTADLSDRNSKLNIPFLDPFVLDAPNCAIAAADGSDGHLYPADIKEFPGASMGLRNLSWYPSDRLDMPWIGFCDLDTGAGYAMIIDTPFDGIVTCKQHLVAGKQLWAPSMIWLQSIGRFSYPRKLIYRFVSKGGYTALAKAYRSYVQSKGLIVPFTEKVKKNPNIEKLFGAPSVWGLLDLNTAREAKTSGIDRMLMQRLGDWLQKRPSAKDIAEINSMGYLTSEYDNYVDIYQIEPDVKVSSNRGHIPEDTVITSDGEVMKAWWDGTQYAVKRCPTRYKSALDSVVPDLLKEYPFTVRFFDVVAAQDLFECYNLRHSLSKAGSKELSTDFFKSARKTGLVTGGEHGIWWAVPYVDYFEGMMSGGLQSWSAGNLSHPKTKDETIPFAPGEHLPKWNDYEKWGIGHQYRVPLWELVFHDCVSTTWYWGDSNDWLLDAAPEITAKKNAFNILYGNSPLLWTDGRASWDKDRLSFMQTYRNVCKLNEVIADKEMRSHKFLTPDRYVQMTHFSDDTQIIVNFGEKPYITTIKGHKHLLPQNGFAVYGPKIQQFMEIIDEKIVTKIKKSGYYFSDESGNGITLQKINKKTIRVNIDKPEMEIRVNPNLVYGKWSYQGVSAFSLDKYGNRIGQVTWKNIENHQVLINTSGNSKTFDLIHK
ncbi:MAG: glycoside hydrolase [Armatimonadota bacterium]